jgi:DNA invertase Pin-like site-specific DNA recombinase
VRLQFLEELKDHWIDVKASPAVVAATVPAWRSLVAACGGGAVESHVKLFARVPPKVVDRKHLEALKGVKCRRVFQEKRSGASGDRPELRRLLEHLREGDTVVWRLDRLARSTRDLLELAETIAGAGAGLRSLGEPWADTTTPAGKMVLTVFAGIAEFERALIRERTGAGRIAAKKRGVKFGRPPKLTPQQAALAARLVD